MLRERLLTVTVTSLIWITCLSCCGGIQVKTWFLDSKDAQSLVRRSSNGAIHEQLSYLEAYGYRCYSEEDDIAWRNRMAMCCSAAKM